MKNNETQFIGMKLKDVEKLCKNVRVVGIGKERFVGTADYNPNRLNVVLSSEGLLFKTHKEEYKGVSWETKTYENKEEGIVLEANFG